MPENRDSDETSRPPLLWAVAACCAVGAAGYLHGVATGKRQGLEMAPEYVAERLAIDRIEAQNDAARLAAMAQPPADRYEMCDRLMEMADHVLLEEATEAQRQQDEAAQGEDRDFDFR